MNKDRQFITVGCTGASNPEAVITEERDALRNGTKKFPVDFKNGCFYLHEGKCTMTLPGITCPIVDFAKFSVEYKKGLEASKKRGNKTSKNFLKRFLRDF